jgi:polyhydroxyalkanoate synthesis regulator phasin
MTDQIKRTGNYDDDIQALIDHANSSPSATDTKLVKRVESVNEDIEGLEQRVKDLEKALKKLTK